jgi:hypothetical protein
MKLNRFALLTCAEPAHILHDSLIMLKISFEVEVSAVTGFFVLPGRARALYADVLMQPLKADCELRPLKHANFRFAAGIRIP